MSISSFAELGISSPFDITLARLEINEPTPVQAQAIPLLLAGHDLVGCAPTGTGKTAAFLLPALTRISAGESRKGSGPRVLVLTPTRELAQQVAKASQAFSRGLQRTSTVCITGGESYIHQNRLLASPYEVLVATPGRLMDQMNAGRVDLSRVEVFVLDEADRMLDMGFSEDVFAIGGKLPAQRQTVCFTATLSRDVRDLTRDLMRDPQWVTVERATTDESTIDQHVLYVDSFDHRHRLLEACLADEGLGQAIVFTSTKIHAEELAGQLDESGHAAEALHGDLNQRQRTRALNRLRRGECRVLVATDVAARGIDVSTITHVINFQLPKFAEDYVHRIGRTGRAGASGQALSFVGHEDVFALRKIEHFIGRKVQVSAIEGLEASFRPTERKSGAHGKKPFRKGGFGEGRQASGWKGGKPSGHARRDEGFAAKSFPADSRARGASFEDRKPSGGSRGRAFGAAGARTGDGRGQPSGEFRSAYDKRGGSFADNRSGQGAASRPGGEKFDKPGGAEARGKSFGGKAFGAKAFGGKAGGFSQRDGGFGDKGRGFGQARDGFSKRPGNAGGSAGQGKPAGTQGRRPPGAGSGRWRDAA
ncbi:MAG: DEAD/DEAH box helicase [Quisquiliibacterium sp.]